MVQKEECNSEIFLRPRFTIACDETVSAIMDTFSFHLKKKEEKLRSKIANNHIFIDIIEEETHFWSPQLHIQVVDEEGSVKIKGLFGPKPQVWTLFMFVHFGVATAFIGACMMFYVKNKLGGSIILPVIMMILSPIVWFLLYFLGSIGKEKSKPQMNSLKQFVKDVLNEVTLFR